MSADVFDDALLDDEQALARFDATLRHLAESGARVRVAAESAREAWASLPGQQQPRAILAAGADARLLRAVLEPWCPVPFVAWPGPSLPGWAGALDLVVVLAPGGGDSGIASVVTEAVRRGCSLVIACPERSVLAEHATARDTTLLPTQSDDALAVAVVMLQALHHLGLGPEVNAESVAAALDDVAVACSPYHDLATNPAKELAIVLADGLPLVWGGTVLAARAARRVAEALRRSSGRAALAADADHLLPVISAVARRDPFTDPFAGDEAERRPALVILEDGWDQPSVREQRGRLQAAAELSDVRTQVVAGSEGPEVGRYASLLATGTYAATYLSVGLAGDGDR